MNTFNESSNSFIIDFCHRISRHDTRAHDHSRVDPTTPYPSMQDVVRRVRSTNHYNESLPDLYNNDTLFALAVKAHFDQQKRADKYERRYNVLRRVLSMGICDWDAKEKNGVTAKFFFPVRYAAVLGNELFKIVEYEETRVSLLFLDFFVVEVNKGFSRTD